MTRTARYLSPGQAAAWVGRRLFAGPGSSSVELAPGPVERSASWAELAGTSRGLESIAGGSDPTERRIADAAVDRRFCFLGVDRHLSDIDWSEQYVSPLWTYRLHYFDFAVSLARAWRETDQERYARAFTDLWSEWLEAVESGEAKLEPYPTSVRCMNALRSLWVLGDDGPLTNAFADRLAAATHAQLTWLAGNIERHLRANHLQRNLTALSWGSLAFGDETAAGWGRFRAELWRELREQVLGDGGHFERSPMYHAHALDDFLRTLELCRAASVEVPRDVPGRLAAMTRALQWLSRPDGTLHLFNDAANDEGDGRRRVIGLAQQILGAVFPEPSGSFALEETGYFGYVDPDENRRLIIDAGPLGPAYQPGHAHCDMLSFELDLAGRSVIVDSGVHGYDGDAYREYVRSTRAHNTVSIGGLDQHEMWSTFRVARRGEILEADFDESDGDDFVFRGACRHYHDRRAVHFRSFVLNGQTLSVTDKVVGASGRVVRSWLHLHPDFRLERSGDRLVAGVSGGPESGDSTPRVHIELFGADDVKVFRAESQPRQGWYCPEFGLARPSTVVEMSLDASDDRAFGFVVELVGPPAPDGR